MSNSVARLVSVFKDLLSVQQITGLFYETVKCSVNYIIPIIKKQNWSKNMNNLYQKKKKKKQYYRSSNYLLLKEVKSEIKLAGS